jgi:hypothetical protein
MHNFVRNVAECTKVGGVFVGTCWDGKTVFNMLRNKPCGDAFTISRYGTRVFQITKMYDYTAFPDDELSLGYSISVFQESIGQHIVEYLVNFDFFKRAMENYGFVLLNREEATQFGFPNGGTGMFDGLYYDMMAEVSREPTNRYGTAPEMTEDEKFISFLNRYFVFRKVRHVAAERITKVIEDTMPSVEASKCNIANPRISVPVLYGSPEEGEELEEGEVRSLDQPEEPEEPEESVSKLANRFGKREAIVSKEQKEQVNRKSLDSKEQVNRKSQEKEKQSLEKEKKSTHFIRPLGDNKITIRTFEPPTEDTQTPEEMQDLPIDKEGPAIQLVPKSSNPDKVIRIGKTVVMSKRK